MAMKPLRSVIAIVACGFLVPALLSATGCKKDEPPPPLPAAPSATATPTTVATTLELAPEPVPSESASAAKPTGGTGGPASSLKKCCAALAQNAASAPPPNNTYLLQASQACNAAVSVGAASPQVMAAVRAALGGAAMPAGCQ
jgi:hypothetical protein